MYDSNRPRHVNNNIPFNLAWRICTIVVDASLRESWLSELKYYSTLCKYPENILNGIAKAKSMLIEELRSLRDRESSEDIMPYAISYHPNYSDHFKCIKILLIY